MNTHNSISSSVDVSEELKSAVLDRRFIVLFKDPPFITSSSCVDPYRSEIAARTSYQTVYVSLLDTISHEDVLRLLLDPASPAETPQFATVVVTSARATTVLVKVAEQSESLQCMSAIHVFALGKATTMPLEKFLSSSTNYKRPANKWTITISDSNNAESLANTVIQWWQKQQINATISPILFLCGDKRLNTLPNALKQANIPLREVCVYSTLPRNNLSFSSSATNSINLQPHSAVESGIQDAVWWVFFSPSGVRIFRSQLDQLALQTRLKIPRLAAIGQTTATAIREMFSEYSDNIVVADTPDATALAKAIAKVDI